MKKIFLTTALGTLLPLCAYTDSSKTASPPQKWPFIEYNNRQVVFPPWHQAYEHIKPEDFYIGVKAWLTGAFRWAHGAHLGVRHWFATIGEIELRGGYNFFYNGRDHFTPFIGGGVFKDYTTYSFTTWKWDGRGHLNFHESHHYRLPVLGYGTMGFLYDHEFNSVFTLGANLKGIIGGGISSQRMRWGSVVVGFDVALPITFRFGHNRHWDIRLEPFDIYLHGSENARNYLGGRSTLGYRF